jgi:hypothetical protein
MNRTLVVGDGWAALASILVLERREKGHALTWVKGSGARILPVLPGLEASSGARAWEYLAGLHGVESGPVASGNFLREFRNKSFRHPIWVKAPTPENRRDVREGELWAPELNLSSDFEARFELLTLGEIEDQLRAVAAQMSNLEVIDGDPIESMSFDGGKFHCCKLGSGREIQGTRLIFADRWAELGRISGIVKPFPPLRGRDPVGLLQVSFQHDTAIGGSEPRPEGFFGPIQREAGEDMQRQVWGHFSSDGKRSHWSVVLENEEIEDNHEIAKKIRRMKQAVDKMFVGPSWLAEGKADFLSTVIDEQVRFEEGVFFHGGKVIRQAQEVKGMEGAWFLTDGYGPAAALEQAFSLLAPQVDLSRPLTAEWESGLATAQPEPEVSPTSEPEAGSLA